MTRKNATIVNRYPADVVYLVAERMVQVLNDVAPNTALMTGEFTPAVLAGNSGRLRNASTVVSDAESKLKSYRDDRDDESDVTYMTIVRIHDTAKGVFGARSVEYKRVKDVYDDLKKKRSRKNNTNAPPNNAVQPPPSATLSSGAA